MPMGLENGIVEWFSIILYINLHFLLFVEERKGIHVQLCKYVYVSQINVQ